MNRRPMRRLSELLPDAIAALGVSEGLVAAVRTRSWEVVIEEVVPAAVGRCEPVSGGPGEVVIRADDAATAQELRLHGNALLAAYPADATGARPTSLRVVVRRDRTSGVGSFTNR